MESNYAVPSRPLNVCTGKECTCSIDYFIQSWHKPAFQRIISAGQGESSITLICHPGLFCVLILKLLLYWALGLPTRCFLPSQVPPSFFCPRATYGSRIHPKVIPWKHSNLTSPMPPSPQDVSAQVDSLHSLTHALTQAAKHSEKNHTLNTCSIILIIY